MSPRIDRVVTSGQFCLDGGCWDVENNIWLIGDDNEVLAALELSSIPRLLVLSKLDLTEGRVPPWVRRGTWKRDHSAGHRKPQEPPGVPAAVPPRGIWRTCSSAAATRSWPRRTCAA